MRILLGCVLLISVQNTQKTKKKKELLLKSIDLYLSVSMRSPIEKRPPSTVSRLPHLVLEVPGAEGGWPTQRVLRQPHDTTQAGQAQVETFIFKGKL